MEESPFPQAGNDDHEALCRVCRGNASEGPLKRPCKCKGSLAHVHEACLENWLQISKGTKCELCKHPFKWENVYASEVPSHLPPHLIIRHLILGTLSTIKLCLRGVFVGFVWIGLLPYSILWSWRGLFYLAKSWGLAWSSLFYLHSATKETVNAGEWTRLASLLLRTPNFGSFNETTMTTATATAIAEVLGTAQQTLLSGSQAAISTNPVSAVASNALPQLVNMEGTIAGVLGSFVDRASEIALSVTGLNTTTDQMVINVTQSAVLPSEEANLVERAWELLRLCIDEQWEKHGGIISDIAQDCFSGQIIVCCVVVAFVTAFLLREWVIANQPQPHGDVAVPGIGQPAAAEAEAEQQQQLIVAAPEPEVHPVQQLQGFLEIPPAPDARMPPPEPVAREFGDVSGERTPPHENVLTANQEEDLRQPFTLQTMSPEPVSGRQNRSPSPHPSPHPTQDQQINHSVRDYINSPEFRAARQASLAAAERRGWQSYTAEEPVASGSGDHEPGFTSPLLSPTSSRFGNGAAPEENTFVNNTERHRSPTPQPIFGPLPQPQPAGLQEDANTHEVGDQALHFEADPIIVPPQVEIESDPSDSEDDEDEEADEDDDVEGDPLVGNAAREEPRRRRRRNRAPIPVEPNEDGDDANEAILPNDFPAAQAMDNEDEIFFEADLEGILEAVGMRGPMLALMQNVALMVLLISVLLAVVVWVPLMVGKTIVATNALRLVFVPINVVRLVTDPVADFLVDSLKGTAPGSSTDLHRANTDSERKLSLAGLFRRFIRQAVQPEAPQSSYQRAKHAVSAAYLDYRAQLRHAIMAGGRGVQARWATMAVRDQDIDRVLCIALGYAVLIAVAALYLRHTQNLQARNATRAVRDALKQQFVLFKAATFFVVEIILFPSLCGILMNIATLPLLPGTTVLGRLAYYRQAPLSSIFLTWLAGTNFMYSFATFISIVRKGIRKGVLWFIRDPTDPDTNPLREILETPAFSQAKKITRSLLVYGGIVLTSFGTLPWACRWLGLGILPLRWDMTRPITAVPIDLIFLLFVTPYTLKFAKPKRTVRKLVNEWCTLTAHQLRVSSFMLGVRRPEEEGSQIRKTWRARLLFKKAPVTGVDTDAACDADVVFRKDGGFARVVAADNVKIVQKKMFVHVHEDGTPLTEEGRQAIQDQLAKGPNDDSKFTVVYIPPHFKARILLFVYLLWVTGSVALFTTLMAPLLVGRFILDRFTTTPLHDTYSMLVGLHALLGAKLLYKYAARRLRVHRRRAARSRGSIGINYETSRRSVARYARMAGGYLLASSVLLHLLFQTVAVLPTLIGALVQLYLFDPFRSSRDSFPSISLSLSWCYGIAVCSIVWSLVKTMPGLYRRLLAQGTSPGILRAASNRIMGLNIRLFALLVLPGVLTWMHVESIRSIAVITGRKETMVVPDGLQTFHAALTSITVTAAAVMLSGPAKKIASGWIAKVWEREYVVHRKLRNIDDPPVTGPEHPNLPPPIQSAA